MPTSSPSGAPSKAPSHAPSKAPTIAPQAPSGASSAANTSGPFIPDSQRVNLTDFSVLPDTNELQLTYGYAKWWDRTTLRLFKLALKAGEDVEAANCEEYYPGGIVGDYGVTELSTGELSSTGPFISWDRFPLGAEFTPDPSTAAERNDKMGTFTGLLDIIESNLTSDSGIFFPDAGEGNSVGSIAFCSLAQLWQKVGEQDGKSIVVSTGYSVSKILVDFDISNATFLLEAGATTSNVTTSSEVFDNIYNITPFVCHGEDDASVSGAARWDEPQIPMSIRPNQQFSICFKTNSKAVDVKELVIDQAVSALPENLVKYIGFGTDQVNVPKTGLVKIVKGLTGPPGEDSNDNKITELRFYALADMFEGTAPSLTLGGRAKLAFASSGAEGRRLGEQRDVSIALRGLQGAGDDAGTAGIELQINLAPTATDMADEDVSHNIFNQGGEGHADVGAEGAVADNDLGTYSAASVVDKKMIFGLLAAVVLGGAVAALL